MRKKEILYNLVLFITISTFVEIGDFHTSKNNYSISTFSEDYYRAFSGNSVLQVDNMLKKIEALSPSSKKKAYKGALLMKKAGLVQKPALKIGFFKEGRLLLEKEITLHENNLEYRFLRFSIQENIPIFLKYSGNIISDKDFIIKNFKKINSYLKQKIIDYTVTSQNLKYSDLQ